MNPSGDITPPIQTPFTTDAPAVSSGFASVEFADNPEPRCPCLLLLDTSGSMQGQAINELNAGLQIFKDELAADALASKRVEVAILSFGGPPTLLTDFTEAMSFQPPHLTASGDTPMGAAISEGIRRLNDRKATYRTNGVAYYRPWIFLITDGGPTDRWEGAAQEVHAGETQSAFSFYAVGVQGANMERLTQIAPPSRPPAKLDGLRFRDLFSWLSKSMRVVSSSTPGSQVNLAAPGWITAST